MSSRKSCLPHGGQECPGRVVGVSAPLLGASSDKLNGEGEGRQPTQSWLHGPPSPEAGGNLKFRVSSSSPSSSSSPPSSPPLLLLLSFSFPFFFSVFFSFFFLYLRYTLHTISSFPRRRNRDSEVSTFSLEMSRLDQEPTVFPFNHPHLQVMDPP